MNENRDHDQLFKTLIREFFAEFLRLFFAVWATRFDLDHVEWLDQEVFPDPPDGSRHLLDLVAKLHAKAPVGEQDPEVPETWLALVHIEIESADRTTRIKPRLPAYYIHLRERSGLPVLPIVIYLKVGLDGIGVDVVEETFWEFEILKFRYLYVALPGLDAVQYLEGDNWLGVALSALMRIEKERMVWLGTEALKRLSLAPLNQQKRYLLAKCVDEYLPLDAEGREAFERAVSKHELEGVRVMTKGFYEQGRELGIEQGRLEGSYVGQLKLLKAILEQKFGMLPVPFVDRLNAIPGEKLVKIGMKALTASELDELVLD